MEKMKNCRHFWVITPKGFGTELNPKIPSSQIKVCSRCGDVKKMPKIEFDGKCNGMSCKICDRYNSLGKCDFHGLRDNDEYCEDFIPGDKLPKKVILEMWSNHSQRFIQERRNK